MTATTLPGFSLITCNIRSGMGNRSSQGKVLLMFTFPLGTETVSVDGLFWLVIKLKFKKIKNLPFPGGWRTFSRYARQIHPEVPRRRSTRRRTFLFIRTIYTGWKFCQELFYNSLKGSFDSICSNFFDSINNHWSYFFNSISNCCIHSFTAFIIFKTKSSSDK